MVLSFEQFNEGKKSKKTEVEVEKLGFNDEDEDVDIKRICELTKLSEEDAEELLTVKRIFETSDRPETMSEMKEAGRMAKWYWKKLEKYPILIKLGFAEEDVNDPTEE